MDAPVAALGSTSVLPADSEGLPKDSVDRRIEMVAFEDAAGTLKALVVGFMFTRASYLWT